jgi:hypothetical protein
MQRVVFVGGVGRLESVLQGLAQQALIEIDFHEGDVRGRGSEGLAARIGRADHVFVVTGTNSHGGVQMAKKYARRAGARVWIVRSLGLASARRIVEAAGRGDDASLRALARCA